MLGELAKNQIIFEAETLSAVVAFILWKKTFFEQTNAVYYLWIMRARFFHSNPAPTVDALAGFFAEHEASVHAFTWLARVPSKSNLADHPSRNDIS